MKKIDASKILSSYRLLKEKIENKDKLHHHHHFKSTNVSKEKIYYFRTSLFTDKSKNMIQKMNSSQIKICKDINEKKEKISSSIRPECRTSYKKSQITYILEKKNENGEIIKSKENTQITANVANLDNKRKNDNKVDEDINQRLRKSYKNLMKVNFNIGNNTEIKKCQNDQKENYQKNNYKVISDIKKCKLFSTFNNIIINDKNNKNNKNNNSIASNNQFGQNLSKMNDKIFNSNTKKKESNQKKELKISDYNKKTIYRLKSRKSIKKNKKNINAISYKSINFNDNNIKKDKKEIKSITKYCKIPAISIFDDSCYISKYKLGNYIVRRKNNRYDNSNVIGDDKINIKKFIKSGIINISALKNKDDFRLSRKDKIA